MVIPEFAGGFSFAVYFKLLLENPRNFGKVWVRKS
jgi:hypothetical protein